MANVIPLWQIGIYFIELAEAPGQRHTAVAHVAHLYFVVEQRQARKVDARLDGAELYAVGTEAVDAVEAAYEHFAVGCEAERALIEVAGLQAVAAVVGVDVEAAAVVEGVGGHCHAHKLAACADPDGVVVVLGHAEDESARADRNAVDAVGGAVVHVEALAGGHPQKAAAVDHDVVDIGIDKALGTAHIAGAGLYAAVGGVVDAEAAGCAEVIAAVGGGGDGADVLRLERGVGGVVDGGAARGGIVDLQAAAEGAEQQRAVGAAVDRPYIVGGKTFGDPVKVISPFKTGVADQYGTEISMTTFRMILPDGKGNILAASIWNNCLVIFNPDGLNGYSAISGKYKSL